MWLESCTLSLVYPCSHQFFSIKHLDTILKLKSKEQGLFWFTTKVTSHKHLTPFVFFSFGKTLCKIGSFSFCTFVLVLVYLCQIYIDWQPGDSSRTRTGLEFMYSWYIHGAIFVCQAQYWKKDPAPAFLELSLFILKITVAETVCVCG